MVYSISFGAIGFIFLLVYDYSQLTSQSLLTLLASIIGYLGLFLALFFQIFLFNPKFAVSWMGLLQIILLGASFFLLIYSVLIEPKLQSGQTSQAQRCARNNGTYGLVRHPGFLWFLLFQAAVIWLCESPQVLIIAVFLSLMDFILIMIEDRYIFPKLFYNYGEYKRQVPMIFPLPFRRKIKKL